MGVLAAVIIPAVLGYLVLDLILTPGQSGAFAEKVALSYPIGMGLLVLQMFFLGVAGVPLILKYELSLFFAEIALLIVVGSKQRRSSRGEASLSSCPTNYESLGRRLFRYLLFAWILIKCGSIFLETYLRPIFAFDSFTNWSSRAKVFFYSNSLLLNPQAHDFFGRGINHSSGNYPPFNPLAQVWFAQWVGSFDEVLVKFWSPFFLLAGLFFLYRIATAEIGKLMASVFVVIFLSSPLLSLHATETFGDLPLGVYVLFAQYATLKCSRGRIEYLPIAGLCCVLAIFIKEEGLFVAIPLFLATCCLVWSGIRKGTYAFAQVCGGLLLPYLLIVPWFVFKLLFRLGSGVDNASLELTFKPEMLLAWGELFVGLHNFNVVFVLIPIMLLLFARVDKEVVLIVVPQLVYALFFLALYLFTVHYADDSRFSQVVFRNTLTYYPSACLLMILLYRKSTCQFPPESGYPADI